MATKTKSKRSTSKRSTAKRSSKPKGIEHVIDRNPFESGSQVEIHDSFGISPPLQGRPVGKPLSTTKVLKDGTLKARVKKPGSYVAVGEVDGQVRRVAFRVKK